MCYVYTAATFPGYFNLKFERASNGFVCWRDAGQATATGVREVAALPVAYALHQNYPNPFNPSTTIRYGLPSRSMVSLTIYNAIGQQVAVLQQGEKEAGYHSVQFNASHLASGVYFYRLQTGAFVDTKKFLLLK